MVDFMFAFPFLLLALNTIYFGDKFGDNIKTKIKKGKANGKHCYILDISYKKKGTGNILRTIPMQIILMYWKPQGSGPDSVQRLGRN